MATWRTPFGGQPVGQPQEVGGHSPEGAEGRLDGAVGADPADAGDDRPLVHIEAGAAAMNDVHGGSPGKVAGPGATSGLRSSFLFVLPTPEGMGATGSGSIGSSRGQARFVHGFEAPNTRRPQPR